MANFSYRVVPLSLVLLLALTSCAPAQPPAAGTAGAALVPAAPREFRAAWIATVGNINWPKRGSTVAEQKQDMITLLDRAVALNLNAVVLQVRPSADAIYKSDLEPWSEYLTGVQGQPPAPYYDPLELWITEAHRRGLELHAWFNPYRVKSGTRGTLAPTSIGKRHPEVVRQYGNYLWMDPGEPVAAQHTLAVILDIVRRYDIDGIHTDDYYYPYKINDRATSKPVDFPDAPSYQRYQQAGGKLAKGDWRRSNVNQLVEKIYSETKKIKPWVKVSYAPFGIWKPGNPPGIKGMNQYEEIYADAKLWLNKGWLDYFSPQLYWKIGGDQDFTALLKWWLAENTQNRHVWPGMSIGRHPIPEVLNQIAETRRQSPNESGQVLWSFSGLFPRRGGPATRPPRETEPTNGNPNEADDSAAAPADRPTTTDAPPSRGGRGSREGRDSGPRDLGKALVEGPYMQKALVPPSPWLDRTAPPPPVASAQRTPQKSVVISVRPGAGEATWLYAVQLRYGQTWRFTTLPGGAPGITINPDPTSGALPSEVAVSAVDRTGNESTRVSMPVR